MPINDLPDGDDAPLPEWLEEDSFPVMSTGVNQISELSAGKHRVKMLDARRSTWRKWEDSTRKRTGAIEETIVIRFAEITTSQLITLENKASLDPRSKLYSLCTSMSPQLFTQEVLSDPKKFWIVLNSLRGNPFDVMLYMRKGKYLDLQSIMPA